MYVPVWNILIVSLTMPTATYTISVSDRKVSLVLYKEPRTWNDAQTICALNNGTLFTQDSPERGHVIKKYKADSIWPNGNNADAWIGLHNPTGDSDGVFGWLTCESQSIAQSNNWKETPDITKRCALIDNAQSEWVASECSNTLMFLCENKGDACTYQESMQMPTTSAEFDNITSTEVTMDACWTKCLNEMNNNRNCWALNWESSSLQCVRYFVDDPFYFPGSVLQTSSSKMFLLKECYNISVVETLTVSVPINESVEPIMGCSTFSATTTKAATMTTTTTSALTTTTAPTTTTGVSKCFCSCKKMTDLVKSRVSDVKLLNLTLAEKVEYLQERLKLNASNLSATKRRLNSAQDDRTEAQALGYVGITFICVILVPVVLSDIFKLLAYIYDHCKKNTQVSATNEPSNINEGHSTSN